MSSIHTQRAKRWGVGTTPFMAEWLANAVDFCHRTSEGKAQFERWVQSTFGVKEGRAKIISCQKPPHRKYGDHTGNAKLWNSAGVELGVCDEAVVLYHQFTAEKNLCTPERTKPAPKRRRGESASEWIARRHISLLDGCKPPNTNWDIARAIAISELDKVRDNIRGWRADPMMLFDVIVPQSVCLVPPDDLLDNPHLKLPVMLHGAFRWCLLGLNLSYLTWSYTTDLFQYLAHKNLSTSSSIKRAYKQDSGLLWRFASCHALIEFEQCRLWRNVQLQISVSPYFRPYFKRTHLNDHDKVEIDNKYLAIKPLDDLLDELVVRAVTQEGRLNHASAFFDKLAQYLADKPSDAVKFSAAAYSAIGDLATTHEFIVNLFGSPFGNEMARHAASINASQDHASAPDKCFMNPSQLHISHPVHKHLWSEAQDVYTSICDTWLNHKQHELNVFEFLRNMISSSISGTFSPMAFDAMWREADRSLWTTARSLDRLDEPGRVAKELGLVNPNDPNKPTFTANIYRLFELSEANCRQDAVVVSTADTRPVAEAMPMMTPINSAAKSGHAFISETKDFRPKDKAKTRGTAVLDEDEVDSDCEENGLQQFPDVLPTEFKLGKKNMKIFHRILPDCAEISGESILKQGQLRWGEFERAMKRIGFDVVQTAGSSVRFDPPARTARPITFHRPHPDSTMSPSLIKWVGARLNRCYGWTASMFSQGIQAND